MLVMVSRPSRNLLLCSPALCSSGLNWLANTVLRQNWFPYCYVLPKMITTSSASTPKPYKDIPGPKGYPFIGTTLDYRNDKYTFSNVMKKRFDKYGPIYREKIFPGLAEQVIICDPSDVETVFRADGEWPNRPVGGDMIGEILKAAKIESAGLLSL